MPGCADSKFMERRENGATMVEYAILLSLIGLLCAVGYSTLATNLSCAFARVTSGIVYADDGSAYDCDSMNEWVNTPDGPSSPSEGGSSS